jgi:hypothetical protein
MFEGKYCSFAGPMVTVLGTSLQNRDLLIFPWIRGVIGLEMEGSYYQNHSICLKKSEKRIPKNVKVRYAYYASDNPLETGSFS